MCWGVRGGRGRHLQRLYGLETLIPLVKVRKNSPLLKCVHFVTLYLIFYAKFKTNSFDPFLLTNENHQSHKNASTLTDCYRQTSGACMDINIIKKKCLTIVLSKPTRFSVILVIFWTHLIYLYTYAYMYIPMYINEPIINNSIILSMQNKILISRVWMNVIGDIDSGQK